MGDFWSLPGRLCGHPEPEHPFDTSTAYIRLPLCSIVGPGGKHPVKEVIHATERLPVSILWSQVAVEEVYRLLYCLYSRDGWIRGWDDLRCRGEGSVSRA